MLKTPVRNVAGRLALGVASTLLITLVAYRFHFNLSAATSVHLFVVTAIALQWGFFEASVVSLLSVACLDYFFTQPLFRFYMTDSHDWVALICFESVALLVSRLSTQVRHHAWEAETNRSQMQKLYELSQNLLLLDRQKTIEEQLANLIQATLQVKGVAVWNAYDLHLSVSGAIEMTEAELRSICLVERNEDNPVTATSQRVLRSGTRSVGALVIYGHRLDNASVNATASLAAIAIERARSFFTESSAEAARQSEQLRSAVLDGLAHAFKTPLTTIRSSSSGLLEMNTLSGREMKLVVLIDEHADHLNELTTRLLRTARIDNAELKLRREAIDLTHLIQRCIQTSTQELGVLSINFQAGAQRSTVWADEHLLEMALFQLLDNAAKYGTPGSIITVNVQEEHSEMLISVGNEGSFIPSEEREKIFKRFYRSPGAGHKASGTGIGLAVVKRITEAHCGRTWVNSDVHTGTTFFLALPRTVRER